MCRGYCCAVALKDWREMGTSVLSSILFVNGLALMRAYMSGVRTTPDHPLMVDWGHEILFRAREKWVCKARRLKKLGQSPRLEGFATSILSVS
jgi:hypothetical protein